MIATFRRTIIRKLRRRNHAHKRNLCGDKYYGGNAYVQLGQGQPISISINMITIIIMARPTCV